MGEIVYHGSNISGTDIVVLLQYVILPYDSHIPTPQGFDVFLKGLAELAINKNLIGNEYFLPKLARLEDEMAESDKDIEEEMVMPGAINDDSECEDYSEEETQDSSEREGNISSYCEEDDMPIVHVPECPRCLWADKHLS